MSHSRDNLRLLPLGTTRQSHTASKDTVAAKEVMVDRHSMVGSTGDHRVDMEDREDMDSRVDSRVDRVATEARRHMASKVASMEDRHTEDREDTREDHQVDIRVSTVTVDREDREDTLDTRAVTQVIKGR